MLQPNIPTVFDNIMEKTTYLYVKKVQYRCSIFHFFGLNRRPKAEICYSNDTDVVNSINIFNLDYV